LDHAIAGRSPVATIVHSDRGSQFRSRKFVHMLSHNGLRGSMGRVGACGDNAAMESFFALLQRNVLDRQRWATRAELRLAIVTRRNRGLISTPRESTEVGAVPEVGGLDKRFKGENQRQHLLLRTPATDTNRHVIAGVLGVAHNTTTLRVHGQRVDRCKHYEFVQLSEHRPHQQTSASVSLVDKHPLCFRVGEFLFMYVAHGKICGDFERTVPLLEAVRLRGGKLAPFDLAFRPTGHGVVLLPR
jgi:hypothetical protein